MSDSFSPSEADLTRANARIRRAAEILELRKDGLLASEAADLADAGGPVCSACGERVPRDEVLAHVESHVGTIR